MSIPVTLPLYNQRNVNTLGIALQYEASKYKIHFLDLNIEVKDGSVITST